MKANGVVELQLHICVIFTTDGGKDNNPDPYHKHEVAGARTGLDNGKGRNILFLTQI